MVIEWKKIILKKVVPGLYSIAGPFIIAYCWNFYHLSGVQRQNELFWLSLFYAGFIFLVFFISKGFFRFFALKLKWHYFWIDEFADYLDELLLLVSLIFFIFLMRLELLSLIYTFLIFTLLFLRLNNILGKHKSDLVWQKVNKSVFLLAGFIFLLTSTFQLVAYTYYLFDSNAKYHNIVLFRSFSLTMFWLGCFALASLTYFCLKKTKKIFLFFWFAFFSLALFLDLINTGLVSSSGLYLSPVILSHFSYSGLKIFLFPVAILLIAYFVLLILAYFIFQKVVQSFQGTTKRHWLFYNIIIVFISLATLIFLGSFWNTPQAITFKNFFDRRYQKEVVLSGEIFEKLEKFGLYYDLSQFSVMKKVRPQEESLDLQFDKSKPNVVLIYLESFSARLTGSYNENYKSVTPNLNDFVSHKNTTLFSNVFNASTPTITSLLASLCSFLPPTGHEEIEREKMLKRQYLTCLPKVLGYNGYEDLVFVTAVNKEFANKNTIVQSTGIKDFYGEKELSGMIKEKPKSWGYSDHQLFPQVFELMNDQKQPFFMSYTTVDNHPPFNLAQDLVEYSSGENVVLNSVHTTDSAFGIFWNKFKESEFFSNTILIVMADHAIFPTALDKKYFPDFGTKTTFYDELFFAIYIPNGGLSKKVDTYGSSMDLAPTILHLLNLPFPDSFEGYSLLGERKKYPNMIGMHEFGLYLNQEVGEKKRQENFAMPTDIKCDQESGSQFLTMCELGQYYNWKRQMLLDGRLW